MYMRILNGHKWSPCSLYSTLKKPNLFMEHSIMVNL